MQVMRHAATVPRPNLLSRIAAISGLYDLALGLTLIFGRQVLVGAFAVPPPTPPIHADLNGLFLVAIGIGYVLPWRRPDSYRGYLWVMGPFLKGVGTVAFVLDHVLRASPIAYLLFAATDGALALATWWALAVTRGGTGASEAGGPARRT